MIDYPCGCSPALHVSLVSVQKQIFCGSLWDMFCVMMLWLFCVSLRCWRSKHTAQTLLIVFFPSCAFISPKARDAYRFSQMSSWFGLLKQSYKYNDSERLFICRPPTWPLSAGFNGQKTRKTSSERLPESSQWRTLSQEASHMLLLFGASQHAVKHTGCVFLSTVLIQCLCVALTTLCRSHLLTLHDRSITHNTCMLFIKTLFSHYIQQVLYDNNRKI